MRFGLLALGGWLVSAVLMVAVSWSAISVVRGAVVPETVVTSGLPVPDETSGPPASSAAPSAAPSARPSPTAAATGRSVSASGVGGTVVVRCVDGVPRFVSQIPRQGFWVDSEDSPGEVRFSSDDHRTDVKASCAGTEPRVEVEEEDRDDNSGPGGGDDDNSGPGGGDGDNSGPGGGDGD